MDQDFRSDPIVRLKKKVFVVSSLERVKRPKYKQYQIPLTSFVRIGHKIKEETQDEGVEGNAQSFEQIMLK